MAQEFALEHSSVGRDITSGQIKLIAACAVMLVFFTLSKQGFFLPQHKTGAVLGASTTSGSELSVDDPNFFSKLAQTGICATDPTCSLSSDSASVQNVSSEQVNNSALLQLGGVLARGVASQVTQSVESGTVAGAETSSVPPLYPRGLPVN